MANSKEINRATKIFKNSNFALLHCVSLYPTKNKANLKRMINLKKLSKIVGFSDHTIGSIASIKAINIGAQIIEKHFTYDNKADGPDHILSANYSQLKQICDYAKNHSKYIGTGKIGPSKKELLMKKFARKSIFAKCNIKKNEKFTFKNIEKRRPGDGIDVSEFEKILMKRSNRNYSKGDLIKI